MFNFEEHPIVTQFLLAPIQHNTLFQGKKVLFNMIDDILRINTFHKNTECPKSVTSPQTSFLSKLT